MSTRIARGRTTGRLLARSAERESFTEHYVTALGAEGGAEEAFTRMAEALTEKGVQPIQEKVLGAAEARESIVAAREEAYRARGLDPAVPFTFVDGHPIDGAELAGVQVWGVSSRDSARCRVTTLTRPDAPSARGWRWENCRWLYLPFVRGAAADGTLATGREAQAEAMFGNASAALRAYGFCYSQVVRTWIYFPHLLDWYGSFNRVRTAHYQREGLGADTPGLVFPASTGIQGRSLGEECFMDVLALDTSRCNHVSVRPIRQSARQGEAFRYGSAFSRGMTLEMDGRKTVYVSGTASIDAGGASVHVGDAGEQGVETLRAIAALLAEEGGRLDDVTSATIYCKGADVFRRVQETLRRLHADPLPWVPVIADVCRPELLVEIEAVAVI